MRKPQRRPPEVEMHATLDLLRTRLAERGYLIAPVAEKYQRRESDFVALRKVDAHAQLSNEFAIVRIAKTCIVVRPFREARGNFHLMVREIRKGVIVPVRIGTPLLNMSDAGVNPWLHYVSDEVHEELATLGSVVRPNEAA